MSEWQPIKTAPKDQILLLAGEFDFTGDWRIKCGFWNDRHKYWELFGGSWTPSHWMPLPKPPGVA